MPIKPRGLHLASFLCLALSLSLGIALILAPLDQPWYSVNEHHMKGRAFASAFGIPITAIIATSLLAGWATLRDKRWSRLALLAALATFWGATAWATAFFEGSGVILGYFWRGLILSGVAALILYGLPSFRRYYKELDEIDIRDA
jgi:hypothetical protein